MNTSTSSSPTVASPLERKRRRNRRLMVIGRHLSDHLILFGILGLALKMNGMTPIHRPFSVEDITIAYPMIDKSFISDTMLIIIALIFPIVVVLAIGVTVRGSWRAKAREAHTGVLGLLLSVGLAEFFTNGAKNLLLVTLARLFCGSGLTVLNLQFKTATRFSCTMHARCSATNMDILNDGYRSFPSNHASMSFAGLTFLTLLLAAHLAIFDTRIRDTRRSHVAQPSRYTDEEMPTMGAWRVLVIMVPIIVATIVSLTRVMEFMHSYTDILCSAIMGIIIAIFAYRYYYTSWVFHHIEERLPSPLSATQYNRPSMMLKRSSFGGDVIDISPMTSRPPSVGPTLLGELPEDLEIGRREHQRAMMASPSLRIPPLPMPSALPRAHRQSTIG